MCPPSKRRGRRRFAVRTMRDRSAPKPQMVRRSNDFKWLNPLGFIPLSGCRWRAAVADSEPKQYMTKRDDHEGWMDKTPRQVSAADFKANCLRLMDEVAQRRQPIIVTKRGKPVAKLVPADDKPIDLFGYMAGTIKIVGDIVSPIEDLEWTADAENI